MGRDLCLICVGLITAGCLSAGCLSACGANDSASTSAPSPRTVSSTSLSYVGSAGITGCATLPSESALRDAARAHHEALERCLESAPDTAPTQVTVWVDVDAAGAVESAEVHATEPENAIVPACFASIIEGWTFEAPGPGCRWTHQVEFRIESASEPR